MNRQRLIVPLLGAVAILLALNLVEEEPEAKAGPPSDFLAAAPTVVGGCGLEPPPLRLLGSADGDIERGLHDMLKEEWLHGEWFKPI